MLRRAASLAASLLVGSVPGDGPLAPGDVVGTYLLPSTDGDALPFVLSTKSAVDRGYASFARVPR